jgi:hypothetical protein
MRYIALFFVIVLSLFTSHGASESYRKHGCIDTGYKGWPVRREPINTRSALGCGILRANLSKSLAEEKVDLPTKIDLRSSNWTVKNQLGLATCAIFTMVSLKEYITGERFSEAELTIRMASGRCIKDTEAFNSIDRGFSIDEFLPFIRAGLIPEDKSIVYQLYNIYANNRPENERLACDPDYRKSIEHAKSACHDGKDTGEFLPKWIEEDEVLFAESIHLIKVARPVGFWSHSSSLKFNIFSVNPCDIDRLKYILNFVPIAIAMHTIYSCDPNTHMIDTKRGDWWDSIKDKRGCGAIIKLYNAHKQKLESSEIAISTPHAVCLCGYDDTLKAFKFRNSWGETYANSGYGYIDYEVFTLMFNRYYKTDNVKVAAKLKQSSGDVGHVYDARVMITHPTMELDPDVLETIERKDPNVLNQMLLEFKQRRAEKRL